MKIALLTTDNREHLKDYSAPEPYFGTAPEALMQGFALLPEAEVHVISCIRQPMKSPEKLADNIWFHPLLVPKIGWLNTGYQGCIRAVRAKLREITPDIVHGQGTERECAISAVFSDYPNVLTLHGNMRLIAKINHFKAISYHGLVAFLEAFTIPRSAGVVCITHYTQEAVKELARRTWVLPNAVDARFFDVVRAPRPTPEILLVGAVCLRKNQNALIRALDGLAGEHDFRLTFLGGANRNEPYGAEFFKLLETRPWCQWGGFASREELRGYLARATALALPSLEDNCPMSVLEAMAAGVPVIAANVGGVPDLVTDGVNGLLCDPLQPGSMASAFRQLLENPAQASQRAQTARDGARRLYHPRVIATRHLEIYHEVLNTSS